MPKIMTEWQRFEQLSADALYELLRFRQDIFVVEQNSPYPDLDGLDQIAWHLRLQVEAELAGYLRLVPMPGQPPLVRIGRVSILSRLRRRGFARMLMEEALRFKNAHYPRQEIVLGAQAHLAGFYEALGFERIGEIYDEFGVPHIDMRMQPHC
jgi:ElaA protein